MAIPVPKAHVGDMPTLTKKITDGTNAIDVSASKVSTLELRFNGPGVTANITLGYETDGTDGLVTADLLSTTWDVAGKWQEQIHVTFVTGTKNFVCTAEFRTVHSRIF